MKKHRIIKTFVYVFRSVNTIFTKFKAFIVSSHETRRAPVSDVRVPIRFEKGHFRPKSTNVPMFEMLNNSSKNRSPEAIYESVAALNYTNGFCCVINEGYSVETNKI